jgi:hypothetical protein
MVAVARGLIGFLSYRNQCLQQITKVLITKQPQALIKGLEYLLPLTQKQLAQGRFNFFRYLVIVLRQITILSRVNKSHIF